ncbi:MAG: hypothetical protein Q9160_001604 [Pyrenula sp. 1 TL-2023]
MCRGRQAPEKGETGPWSRDQRDGDLARGKGPPRCTPSRLNSLAKLLTLLEIWNGSTQSVQPSGLLEAETRNVTEQLEHILWSLARKAEKKLTQIVEYTESKDVNIENCVYRTLEVISDFDMSIPHTERIKVYQCKLLRKAIALQEERGHGPETFRLIRRLSRVSGNCLSQKEERLFATSINETSLGVRPLLEEHDLLPDGALTLRNVEPFPAVHLAIQEDSLNVVRHIYEKRGKPLRDLLGRSAMHVAAASGSMAGIKTVLEFETHETIRDRDDFRRTPLFHAAFNGHLNVVEYLSGMNACTSDRDKFGQSILCAAAGAGHLEIVRRLLDAREPADDRPLEDVTPLYKAAEGDHTNVCRLLLKYGANPKDVMANKKTAYQIASEKGYLKTFNLIHHRASLKPLEQSGSVFGFGETEWSDQDFAQELLNTSLPDPSLGTEDPLCLTYSQHGF